MKILPKIPPLKYENTATLDVYVVERKWYSYIEQKKQMIIIISKITDDNTESELDNHLKRYRIKHEITFHGIWANYIIDLKYFQKCGA